ncbi:hypothetical protein FACS189452_09040 [Bacteroidia bacterium]|nr:hypothetical protein FACS189452_09040 [Bacteroidia bacterium]
MKLTLSEQHNPNYTAKIVRVTELKKHPNADRLMLATIYGEDIIVDDSCRTGDMMVHFPIECCIAEKYLVENSLYRKGAVGVANKNPERFGFFEKNGRVRATRIRGLVSNGFLMPVASLTCYLQDGQKLPMCDGTKFDEINGEQICKKYVPKFSRSGQARARGRGRPASISARIVERQFRFHYDTEKLEDNLEHLFPNQLLHISYKMHGTSAIFSRILVRRTNSVLLNVLLKLLRIKTVGYQDIWSSRKVIKNQRLGIGKTESFYAYDVWTEAYKSVMKNALEDGISIYAEIVGYLPEGAGIQGNFDYGCTPHANNERYEYGKHYDIYIYRVTRTDADGRASEYSPQEVQQYCAEHGLKPVITLCEGIAETLYPIATEPLEEWRKNFYQSLKSDPRFHLEQRCIICQNDVPAEGIVIRIVEASLAFKVKSKAFLIKESAELDAAQNENIEDAN